MIPANTNSTWVSWGDVIIRDEEDRVFDVSNLYFSRSKNNQATHYQLTTRIAAGSLREVYSMYPLSSGKFKAIKISFPDNSNSQKESQILNALNSHGRQTGISKPDKAFFVLPSGVKIQVMPNYHQSLLNYLVGDVELNADITEVLRQCNIPEQQVIQILKQITSGVMYLKERSVFHGDIDLRNILCSWSIPIRFDLMDFEDGIDFSRVNTLDDLYRQLSERRVVECESICAANSALSESQKVDLCKQWLLSQDALSFAFMLEYSFVHLLKSDPNVRLLDRIIALIKQTQSIDGVFAILQQMQDHSELPTTLFYYAKSQYDLN